YRLLNEAVRDRRGGLHSAPILLESYDFAEIEALQAAGDWDAAGALLADSARRLEAAGAGLIGLCTNTMHVCAPAIISAVGIPFIDIADATGATIAKSGRRRPLLLATRFTMEMDFYREGLRAHGLDPAIPDDAGRMEVHRVIYDELCRGVVRDDSREAYRAVIARGADADSVIFGCTEISMLLAPDDVPLPVFDSVAAHVDALVTAACA
ncbi:MAG: amino acid racemase, partial [Pseudomonadota bacterium]